MKPKRTPGTNHEGMYLVRQLVDYANSLLNVTIGYITINVDWPAEVFIVYGPLVIIGDYCSVPFVNLFVLS